MDIGTVLLYISLILAILAGALAIIDLIFNKKGISRFSEELPLYAKLASIFLFVMVTGALLLLYVYFITSNMNIKYVWEYSSKSLPMEYKISGVLAGMAGSLLFWIWCMAFSWFVEEIKDFRRPKNGILMGLTRATMMIIISIFLYFLIIRDLFEETPQNYINAMPEGQSLNPLLQTPLMIVHPPIVFLAYGFMVICLASAMAYLICNDKNWVKLSMPWSRWAWLFLTLGIGIGGLWAYVVLGWGGYWAWDPVETSSFLPWLLLTALLHAQLMFKRKGDYRLAAPALGIFTFVMVIFATFTTRAGGIWLSVHAFGEADVNVSAYDRFVDVVTSDNIILGYFILMIGLTIIGIILLLFALMRIGESEEDSNSESKRNILEDIINDKSLMFITLILFTITTIVTLLLLIMAINGVDRMQFDTKVGIFAIIGIIVLVFCLAWKYLGRRTTSYSVLLAGVVSLVLGIAMPDQWMVGVTFPFLALAVVASIYKIIKSINPKSLRASINKTAPHIVHLGVVFIIIGFVGSNFLVTEKDITLVRNGQAEKVGDYEFKMVDGRYSAGDHFYVTIEILRDGNVVATSEPGAIYLEDQWRNEIAVSAMPTEDVYIIFVDADAEGSTVTNANLQVKILPLMNVLWLGMWLLAIGILMRLIVELSRSKKKTEKRVEIRAKTRSEMQKTQEYYESLIEKELEEMK
ncbi:MAG: cytochrome c biogenesis protein CcsA [Methanomassiliicoccales archaeon]|nr:MAG: cytochrome c biogenesis protein CcsA [Methanomassiliicoccales archaeon]